MLSAYVSLGDRVELKEIKRNADADEEKGIKSPTHICKVHDFLSEEEIEITMPIEKGKLVVLSLDQKFDCFFFSKGNIYQGSARVADRYKKENIYIIKFEMLSGLRKVQRRDYYRLSCAIPIEIRYLIPVERVALERDEVKILPNQEYKKGIIIDISGGGLRFVTRYELDMQKMIFCKFQLMADDTKSYEIPAHILYMKEIDASGVKNYEYRVQFANITEIQREEIIKYIFEKEREYRRKEKGE